jgi:outer membrane protein OmpA-like peptidoglycan-associated protein
LFIFLLEAKGPNTMKRNGWMVWALVGAMGVAGAGGCAHCQGWFCKDPVRVARPTHEQRLGPPYDRPFPLGQVTDAHWETQQTNAEAADFILYDHEFIGNTAQLTPKGQKHLVQIALRLEHVPFPIVVEQSPDGKYPQLDAQRRQAVIDYLVALGYEKQRIENRVVVAPAFAEGLSAVEGEAAYYSTFYGQFYGGTGRRYGGTGGFWR